MCANYPAGAMAKDHPRPGDSLNVARIEFENLESAVHAVHARIEKLEAKMDGLQRDIAELKKAVRRG